MKPQKKQAVWALLERGVSQHEIARKMGIDHKTIRRLARVPADAPMATGPHRQNPPPRPPAMAGGCGAITPGAPSAHSACEDHRAWIEAQVRLGRNAMAIHQENDHRPLDRSLHISSP